MGGRSGGGAAAPMAQYGIKAQGTDAVIEDLSGGNIQRLVLARELSGPVSLLIAQNPCQGLDYAATSEIRSRLVEARDSGAAVVLLSEDLDELLELADRLLVLFEGRIVFECDRAGMVAAEIGRHLGGRLAGRGGGGRGGRRRVFAPGRGRGGG